MAAKRKSSKPKAVKDLKPGKSAAQTVKGGYVPSPSTSPLDTLKRKILGANPK